MKHTDYIKSLMASISKDETRPYLHYVYYDAELKRMISTDGRTLVSLDSSFFIGLDESGLYVVDKDGNTFKTNQSLRFPDYKRALPSEDSIKTTITVNIPYVKSSSKKNDTKITLLDNGNLIISNIKDTPVKSFLTSFNLRYIEEYCGQDITFFLQENKSATKAFVAKFNDEKFTHSDLYFKVIMPIAMV